jgi:hypothetical protein
MTDKGDEPSTTDGLQYPMVDLFTGGIISPLMFINAAAAWRLLSLNAPSAFLEAWSAARFGVDPGTGQRISRPA